LLKTSKEKPLSTPTPRSTKERHASRDIEKRQGRKEVSDKRGYGEEQKEKE
jgi:hypothetical protein